MKTNIFVAATLLSIMATSEMQAQRRRADNNNNPEFTNRRDERNNQATRRGDDETRPTRNHMVYKKSPRVHAERCLPEQHRIFHHENIEYYWNEGQYYNFNNGKFILIAPPVGLRVNVLPVRRVRLDIDNRPYFYFDGVFYEPVNGDEYIIVDAPIGAMVADLPYDAEKVEIDDSIYYLYNNTLFKKVRTGFGRVYEVVGKI